MNRWDLIQATARDVADWVCANPDDRNRMAGDLIKLVGLMVDAVGKGVAIDGESNIGDPDDPDDESAYARYITGEAIQRYAQEAVTEATDADLERYERDGLKPVWTSRRARNEMNGAIRTVAGRVLRFVPGTVKHPVQLCDDPDCPTHGDAEAYYRRVLGLDATPTQHTWVTATDGDTGRALDYQHCGVCGIRKCDGGCGDASVGATPDVDCAVHGDDIGRLCFG